MHTVKDAPQFEVDHNGVVCDFIDPKECMKAS